jgi:octanoyl-[GcvH]:protein N-octanoyltransferase
MCGAYKGRVQLIQFGARHDAYEAIATEHVVARRYGPTTLMSWVHERALVIGLRETTFPCAVEAMTVFGDEGEQVVVRPSGGAAVPLDAGVLNVALVLPAWTGSIHDDFMQLVTRIYTACAQCGVHTAVGEVRGAVCPGAYDIHVDGAKIAGISQHRSATATIVHAFINVSGDAQARAQRVQRFYARAHAKNAPPIVPSMMTTMSDVSGRVLTVHDVWDAFACDARMDVHVDAWSAEVSAHAQRIRMRYDPRSAGAVL